MEIDPEVFAMPTGLPVVGSAAADDKSLISVERDHIDAVLRQTNWVIEGAGGAANVLAMHPNTLRSRLKKLGIVRPHEAS